MLSFCLVGVMFNIEHKISVSTIVSKNKFYRLIDISHSNISIFLYRRYINGITTTYNCNRVTSELDGLVSSISMSCLGASGFKLRPNKSAIVNEVSLVC
jgi:hypothetical protein